MNDPKTWVIVGVVDSVFASCRLAGHAAVHWNGMMRRSPEVSLWVRRGGHVVCGLLILRRISVV